MFQEECEKWCEFDIKLCRESYEKCSSNIENHCNDIAKIHRIT